MTKSIFVLLCVFIVCFVANGVSANVFGGSSSSRDWSGQDVTVRPKQVTLSQDEFQRAQPWKSGPYSVEEQPQVGGDFGWWAGLKWKLLGIEPESFKQRQQQQYGGSSWGSSSAQQWLPSSMGGQSGMQGMGQQAQNLGSRVVDKLSDIGSAAIHLPQQAYHSVADTVRQPFESMSQQQGPSYSHMMPSSSQSLTEKAKNVLPSFLGGQSSSQSTQYQEYLSCCQEKNQVRHRLRQALHEQVDRIIENSFAEDRSLFESISEKVKSLVPGSHADQQQQHGGFSGALQQMAPHRYYGN